MAVPLLFIYFIIVATSIFIIMYFLVFVLTDRQSKIVPFDTSQIDLIFSINYSQVTVVGVGNGFHTNFFLCFRGGGIPKWIQRSHGQTIGQESEIKNSN